MRKVTVLILSATIVLSACGGKPNKKEVARKIDSIVERIRGPENDGEEYAEARKYHFLDVNGDGEKDVVTFFTIEGQGGGNMYLFYMSVLLAKAGVLSELGTVEVGGKGIRNVNFDKVTLKEGLLELETTEYGPDDGMCCPSIESTSRVSLAGGTIKQVSLAPNNSLQARRP